MSKVAPILVTYFADFELWTEFHLMKIRIFFIGLLLATNCDVWIQTVVQTSPNSYLKIINISHYLFSVGVTPPRAPSSNRVKNLITQSFLTARDAPIEK